ncbi:MAG TPA: nucleotidyltransferase domain-containing protein [bacterium]|nr:nucleotidyltransferase domain-containing protein [bacterium]
MKPSRKVLKQLTQAIVDLVHPKRIILFGSAARGDMGKHSDLDILVVMPNGAHRSRTYDKVYLGIPDFDFATDLVIITEKDIRQHGSNPYLVIYHALKEGREIYRAA